MSAIFAGYWVWEQKKLEYTLLTIDASGLRLIIQIRRYELGICFCLIRSDKDRMYVEDGFGIPSLKKVIGTYLQKHIT